MYELLLKDFGLCRNVLKGGVFALLVPYIAVIVYRLNAYGLTAEQEIEFYSMGLLKASQNVVWLSMFTIAFLGGFIVAGERRDGSAEFLAFLPPSRSSILLSKAIVCFAWMIVVATVYFSVTDLIVPWISNGDHMYSPTGREIWYVVALMFAVFGTSWLFSTLLDSAEMAVLVGLVIPYPAVITLSVLFQVVLGWEVKGAEINHYTWLCLIFGAATFVGGCWHYTSRIEP